MIENSRFNSSMIGELINVTKKENIILLNSKIKLSPSKMNSFIREVGMRVFSDSKWLYTAVSKDYTKALAVNLADDRYFIEGWILRALILAIPVNEPKYEKIRRYTEKEVELFKRLTYKDFPDEIFSFEAIENLVESICSMPVPVHFFIKSKSSLYEPFIQKFIDIGYIDKDFNLKVSISVLNTYLKDLANQFMGKDTKVNFRICPVCLTPIKLLGKAVRKNYCDNCNKHRKTITKRVEALKNKIPRHVRELIEEDVYSSFLEADGDSDFEFDESPYQISSEHNIDEDLLDSELEELTNESYIDEDDELSAIDSKEAHIYKSYLILMLLAQEKIRQDEIEIQINAMKKHRLIAEQIMKK